MRDTGTYRDGRPRQGTTGRGSEGGAPRQAYGAQARLGAGVRGKGDAPLGVEERDVAVSGRTIAIVLAALLAIVSMRLVYLQVIDGPRLKELGTSVRSNEFPVKAKRGTIYDRNGKVLATSVACTTVTCNPKEVTDQTAVAQIMAQDLGGEPSSYLSALSGDTTFSYVRRQVDTDKADQLKSDLAAARLPGVYYMDDMRREYPYGAAASQVLGVVGVDGDGLTGLEKYYDGVLSGTNGTLTLETGNGGIPIAGGARTQTTAVGGTDIQISLDIDVQQKAEEVISRGVKDYKADSGSVMVSDPRTGEVIAACSTPLFDVTNTSRMEEGATSLKPVSSSFEPGSIFKLITMSIGIEDGLITPDSTFDVPAQVKVGDDMVRDDDKRKQRMDMTIREMLRRSSNVGTALVAQNVIGADRFAQGLQWFGIGTATGIDFPGEANGIVRQRSEYDGASLGSMSFGQSLSIPLDQMVKAVGSIANDGVLETPHFLLSKGGEQASWPSPGASVSPSTASQVTDMMRTVVKEGTAEKAQVRGYDIAGKTGTGEQASESGGYEANKYVSSLIGFAPAGDAQVLVYVGLNGTPYLATNSAAPLFSTIMGEALSELQIPPGT
ncbi:peptidoglycan D,D-transpeptidase FtsI family protein [Olsenella profusa]|uniref:peptidoglycan D,D-transpeptidase FtsI family protein n=1 Tax=Olsenella profusa TaxID=138595 RepID=UPI001E489EC8|nr:penicillin-binding protein 2 [Olsenella profusa]